MAGAALLVLLLLVVGIRGCLGARKDRAFKNYAKTVAGIVNSSNTNGNDLFSLLSSPGENTPIDLSDRINSIKADADRLVEQASDIDTPGELEQTNEWLIAALELRRDGLEEIARLLPQALGEKNNTKAMDLIAGQMQVFLASDVLYLQRFLPETEAQFKKRDVGDLGLPKGRFFNDLSWLSADTVASKLANVSGNKAATPGVHGVSLMSVTAKPSETTLDESATTDIQAESGLSFDVEVQNQGENEETDVAVVLTVPGPEKVELEQKIDSIAPGESQSVNIPFTGKFPDGPTTLEVNVVPVPGEETTDNNKATYPVLFQK